jgi:ADP-heptose:LPS heptosyltransferase
MTKNIGVSAASKITNATDVKVDRILICRPNHRLGNQLLMTPLLQELGETFPWAQIDLLVKGKLGPIIFKNYSNVRNIIQLPSRPFSDIRKYLAGWIKIRKNRYDLVVNVVHHSSSGRIATKFANAKYRWFGDSKENFKTEYADYEHAAKEPVYSFREFLNALGLKKSEKSIATVNLKLSPAEITEGKKILDGLVTSEKETIGIFTYATGAKCHSQIWWEDFYRDLKNEFADYNILEVLPAENVSQISFKAPSYYSRDIREIASVIANMKVFIGADSGMMHLAVSSQTPTVGLFNVTNPTIFGPYGNKSLAVDTNIITNAECIRMIKAILTGN